MPCVVSIIFVLKKIILTGRLKPSKLLLCNYAIDMTLLVLSIQRLMSTPYQHDEIR